jgi:hypothetical protein
MTKRNSFHWTLNHKNQIIVHQDHLFLVRSAELLLSQYIPYFPNLFLIAMRRTCIFLLHMRNLQKNRIAFISSVMSTANSDKLFWWLLQFSCILNLSKFFRGYKHNKFVYRFLIYEFNRHTMLVLLIGVNSVDQSFGSVVKNTVNKTCYWQKNIASFPNLIKL